MGWHAVTVRRRVFAWITAVDACFIYRIKLPLEALDTTRWAATWGPPPPDIHDYDVVIGQRLAGSNPEWLALCADPNVLTVYDADDDLIWLDPENEVPYSIYAPLSEDTKRNVQAADVVTTCTPYVAERYTELNDNVHVLPICVDAITVERPLLTTPDRLTVGWAGSPFHRHDWEAERLTEVLVKYLTTQPRATFHALGSDYTDGRLEGRARVSGYQTHNAHLASFDIDIGLAPLNRTSHNRGKSWTRPLEYAARGAPVIATRWGQYPDWVQHGVNGFIVDTFGEWLDALDALTDDTMRGPMSTAARESARRATIGKHIHLWERAYEAN